MGQDQRRAAGLPDHLGHRVGLPRAGNAEQHLVGFAVEQAPLELFDGRSLVAAGLVRGNEAEVHRALIRNAGLSIDEFLKLL